MKIMLPLFVLRFLSAQPNYSVSDLNWLAGHWEMVKGERVTEEQWLSESGNAMLGVSRTVRGGKLLEYEFIVLEQDSIGNIYYRAKPVRQSGASFKLVKLEQKTAIFENRHHDFPQLIFYTRISEDSLLARIEGEIDGKVRSILFPYRKKQ